VKTTIKNNEYYNYDFQTHGNEEKFIKLNNSIVKAYMIQVM